MDRVREALRVRHLSLRTEKTYGYDQITVRDGKGAKGRMTMLPATLKTGLQEHLKEVKRLHDTAHGLDEDSEVV